jgi:hypothetical protein
MPVARDGRETHNSVVANEVVDFTALDVCSAVIAGAGARVKSRIFRVGPRFGQTRMASGSPAECLIDFSTSRTVWAFATRRFMLRPRFDSGPEALPVARHQSRRSHS